MVMQRKRFGTNAEWDAKADAATKFKQRVELMVSTAAKAKKIMATRGINGIKFNCPSKTCSGLMYATVNGPKKHLHMRCDACDLFLRE